MGSHGVSVDYISVGGNRQTAVADWSRDGLLAFGADTNVALWAPNEDHQKGISKLLRGHGDVVKAVTFLPQEDGDEASYLVSGANDRSLIIWKSSPGGRTGFAPIHTLQAHAGAINCIAALRLPSKPAEWLIASGASDATIRIWSLELDKLTPRQTIKTAPKFFPLSLCLSWLGDGADVIALAAAGTQDAIQILTADGTGADAMQFRVQASLRGHEGWIRSLSFVPETDRPGCDLLLASASQDKYVRLWRFHQGPSPAATDAAATATTAIADDGAVDSCAPGNTPSSRAYRFSTAGGRDFSVTFEALLLGHEDWIYSASWHAAKGVRPRLLTASADSSLAIWEADPVSGVWVSTVRLGEISREKGATTATGSTGGFWTALWSPDGRSVVCLGRTGSWRRWERDPVEDTWRPRVAVSGHTKAVTGIAWSANGGDYLLSASLDQTTRLHAQWTNNAAGRGAKNSWHEMSRPQIHGYDLNCIDSLDATHFVSGADEKLMRVFGEPRAVASILHQLSGINHEHGDGGGSSSMPDAANMPVLGLSNKAVDDAGDNDGDESQSTAAAAVAAATDHLIDCPPFEETLSRATLWPETEKLYGHGYELSCLAASHDGRLVASACRASSLNHAVIRLFETERWTELRPPLSAHTLTATRLRFSPDDEYLLSVGRDRQWAVFARALSLTTTTTTTNTPPDDESSSYALLQANPKGHSRMILDCAWAPFVPEAGNPGRRRHSPLFATAGRDKQVRIWCGRPAADKMEFALAATLSTGVAATAVDFLPWIVGGSDDGDDCYVLALGTENGLVGTYALSMDGVEVREVPLAADRHLPKAVLQLAWRPRRVDGDEGGEVAELAVAGDDASLRIYSFHTTGFLKGLGKEGRGDCSK